MICKMKQAIQKYEMLDGVKSVAVALSGGADSVALLHLLKECRSEYGFHLFAVHLNHGLRGEESQRDENFVIALCEELKVPIQVKHCDIRSLAQQQHIGLEECGRRVRYTWFESLDVDKVATAHNLSDSLETMLFHLSRGCSLSGLSSIPPVRGKYIRPLIFCTGDEIRQYCQRKGYAYVVDSSNYSDDYQRNRIRHTVVPPLAELNEGFYQNFSRCLESIRDDNAFFLKLTNQLVCRAALAEGYDCRVLCQSDEVLIKRAIYQILYQKSGVMPEQKHIESMLRLLYHGGKAQLCGGLYCLVKDSVWSFPNQTEESEPFQIKAALGKQETPYAEVMIKEIDRITYDTLPDSQKRYACFSADAIVGEWVLRSRMAGDKLYDITRKNTKSLKKLFTETKTPITLRNRITVCSDEIGILWIEGFGVDGRCRVTRQTKKIYWIQAERK